MTACATHADVALGSAGKARSGTIGRFEMLALRASACWRRLTRWEFWPSWAVYAPLVPYIAWLGVRHGGLRVCTRVNPGIPRGGIVGESKWDILRMLPPECIAPAELLRPGPLDRRRVELARAIAARGWSWPVVMKPDVGERGKGVRLVRDLSEADAYLRTEPGGILLQRYHPGPYEAGVFYARFPGEPRGRIFSITEKRFAVVVGDGRSTIHDLVWRHPRYRIQARAHLASICERAAMVPGWGERVPLGFAGNHCRGAMFLDGKRLMTPELRGAFDEIALRTKGFYFGRFDVRYADEAAFKSGRGLEILELNGLLSESTNIYDPSTTFWRAQRVLRDQWRLAFAIGAAVASRQTGTPPSP